MQLISTTPFGQRPMTATLMKRAAEAQEAAEIPHIDKWALFRDLCTARHTYDVTDRDLTVLNALLSFHQAKRLSDNDNLIVFPSNKALSERAHGMAESTLRRHLAALTHAGLIQRHDSPNGKRYAARDGGGDVIRAFGFDLRPLLVRAADITRAAAEAEAAAERLRRLREEVVVMKRDALKLCLYGQESGADGPWEAHQRALFDIHKLLRRKMSAEALEQLVITLKAMLAIINAHLQTKEMSGSDVNTERHLQNSNKDSSVLEPCLEKQRGEVGDQEDTAPPEETQQPEPNLPLALVVKACPDILPYAQDDLRHWHQLVALAGFVRGMMGISPDAWAKAQRAMGPEVAAITVAGILQRVAEINCPGGYLGALTRKAEDGAFSPGPMIMALLNTGQRS
ncbi:MAG: plasmid replication protein RepC [Pseudomonadota bacterium]